MSSTGDLHPNPLGDLHPDPLGDLLPDPLGDLHPDPLGNNMKLQRAIPSMEELLCNQQSLWKDNNALLKDFMNFMKDK